MPKVRQKAAELVRKGWSTREVARHFGYSQSAVVKWTKQSKKIGYHPIPTTSSKPKHHPKELDENIIDEIVKTRLKINRSAEVVHKILIEEKNIKVSLSSVKRTLDRRGLTNKRSPWKRFHTHIKRPEVLKPGDLIQVDTIHLMTGEKTRIYVFTLIDIFTRMAYARSYERCNTRTAAEFLKRAQLELPFKFNCIQSDNGSEFSSHFTDRVRIKHRHSRVRKPNDNAHIERFNRTIQEECLDGILNDVKLINQTLPEYLDYYNNRRHHFGIDLKKPIEMSTSY